MSFASITPAEFAARRTAGESLTLIDVREIPEWEAASVEGARLYPMSRFPDWIPELNPSDEIVVMCRHGIRSAQICSYLVQSGFSSVWNLSGGIDAWSRELDPSIPRYY